MLSCHRSSSTQYTAFAINVIKHVNCRCSMTKTSHSRQTNVLIAKWVTTINRDSRITCANNNFHFSFSLFTIFVVILPHRIRHRSACRERKWLESPDDARTCCKPSLLSPTFHNFIFFNSEPKFAVWIIQSLFSSDELFSQTLPTLPSRSDELQTTTVLEWRM